MPEPAPAGADTGYYVYGVVPVSDAQPISEHGIDETPVEFVEHGGLAAAVTPMVLERPPGRRAELLAHTAVVDALASRGSVLPMRFGSVLADRESVTRDLLEPSQDRFVRMLVDLRGCHQFNLRATYVEEVVLAEVVRADPAIAELRRRTASLPEGTLHPDLVRLGELVSRAIDRRRDVDAQEILEVVQPLVRDETHRPSAGLDHVLDVALLVMDERREELEDYLEALAEKLYERVRLRLVGPVAPYDFAEAQAWG